MFPDEGHNISRPENFLNFDAAVEVYLSSHLGGRAESLSNDERVDEFQK
jgi:hypothetical protein